MQQSFYETIVLAGMIVDTKQVCLFISIFAVWCLANSKVAVKGSKRFGNKTGKNVRKTLHVMKKPDIALSKEKVRGRNYTKGLANGVRKSLSSALQSCEGLTCIPVPVPIRIEQIKEYPVPVPTRVDTVKNVLKIHIHDGGSRFWFIFLPAHFHFL